MIGFRVTLATLEDEVVEGAVNYTVTEDGGLVLRTDGHAVATFRVGEWLEVHPVGTRLTERWPPPGLHYLMHDLTHLLVARWGNTGQPATAEDVASEVFNDAEALLSVTFDAVGASLDDHRLRDEALDTIRRFFAPEEGLRTPG